MVERHSPALHYPLQPSRFLHRLWWGWLLLSGGVLLTWLGVGAGLGAAFGVRVGGTVVLWLLCAGSAWYGLQRQPSGYLHWSGQAWTWENNGKTRPLQGAPVVSLDLQVLLVLSWQDEQGRRWRCVLQRDWAPQAWGDVRRAVYSSVHPTRDASSQPER